MTGTRHVVLVTYGEPPTPSFLDQLTYSWRILVGLTRTVAPIPRPLLPVIALARARGRRASWTGEGYGSPLEAHTRRQADALGAALAVERPEASWRVHIAYEFRRPLLDEVLAGIPHDQPVTVAPMYAADSAFTHALSRTTVAQGVAASRPAPVRVAPALDADVLAELSAAHVLETLAGEADWRGPDVALVLAAHGTVLDPPTPIDTGLVATETLCETIRGALAPHFGVVVNGWLNHTRGGRWTDPPIESALAGVVAQGFRKIVYYPYGFLADNAESELEGRVALAALDGVATRQLPCLNDSPALASALARQMVDDPAADQRCA